MISRRANGEWRTGHQPWRKRRQRRKPQPRNKKFSE